MNIAEKLSREVERITVIREHHRAAGDNSTRIIAAISLLSATLEAAHEAAGSGDALTIIRALKVMEGMTK